MDTATQAEETPKPGGSGNEEKFKKETPNGRLDKEDTHGSGDFDEPFEVVVKLNPSDVELSGSEDEGDEAIFKNVKQEIDSEDYDDSSSVQSGNDNSSVSWNASSEEEEEYKHETSKEKMKVEKKGGTKRKGPSSSSQEPKRPRGRPKQPRRLNIPEGAPEDYTSGEESSFEKPVLRPGSGYPVEFKLQVLKYADTHSNAATAEKFGLQPKRVRDWKKSKNKIEAESQGSVKRRPRTDGYTVEEKLQAIAFASERSTDEARLLYNVDKRTIEKWKAKKEQLETRVLLGEGNFIRRGGSGRKPRFTQIEESLRDWIVALRLKGVTVNYKMILNKAKMIMEEDSSMKDTKVPTTRTWVIGFLKRQNLHGLLGTTLGHEDPRELLNNVQMKTKDGDIIKNLVEQLVDIPENPNKRNRRTISLADKVNIIRRIEQGETQGTVAKSLKVATSTVQTIWSCRNEILHRHANPKSKTKSDALLWKTYSSIGSALHDWLEQNGKVVKINCNILMEKAIQLSETYRLPQFHTEAKHWLRLFCRKNKLQDVLVELRGNYAGPNPSSLTYNSQASSQPQTLPFQIGNTTTAVNSVGSNDDHHDDDFQSDFNLTDFLSTIHTDAHGRHQPQPPTQQHQHLVSTSSSMPSHPQMPGHHPAENQNGQRFSTTCNNTPTPHTSVTSSDAIKYISLLRSWIQSNYGPHENILNTHLAAVENAVIKQRMAEMGHSSGHSHH